MFRKFDTAKAADKKLAKQFFNKGIRERKAASISHQLFNFEDYFLVIFRLKGWRLCAGRQPKKNYLGQTPEEDVMDTRVKNALGIVLVAVIVILGGLAAWKLIVWQPPVAQTGTALGGGSAQTQSGENVGPATNTGGNGQRELSGDYNQAPARTWADWPGNRINPEENHLRDTGETNWEDLTDLEWLWPDGTTSVGTRRVDANGQKFGILLSEGPFGLTGKQVIEMLLKNVNDRSWVVRATPEGQSSGGWWTIELLKPGASESAIPGLLVPSSGKVVTWTLQKGRTDYWGGFPAPIDPKGVCEAKKLVDADSGLNQWQVVCREGGSATIKSDGATWMPAVMYFDDFTK